jgi:hypothetical protein
VLDALTRRETHAPRLHSEQSPVKGVAL